MVVGLAVLVLVVPQAIEAVLGARSDHLLEIGQEPTSLFGLVFMVAELATMLGFVFYAGLLDHVVAEHQWGHDAVPLRQIARGLPWIRLILADLLFAIIVAVSAVALVIPGLIAMTYLGLIGPVINIERRGLFASFVRTAKVVHGHFWLVACLVTGPILFEGVTEDWLHEAFDHEKVIGVLLATVLGVAIAAVIGVVEVTLAHELLRRDPATVKASVETAAGTVD